MIEAAKATRRYRVGYVHDYVLNERRRVVVDQICDSPMSGPYKAIDDAQAACDRFNLLAVLRAIREPSEAMAVAGGFYDPIVSVETWHAMIDALIAEMEV